MSETKETLQKTSPAAPRPAVMWQVEKVVGDKNETLTIKFPREPITQEINNKHT